MLRQNKTFVTLVQGWQTYDPWANPACPEFQSGPLILKIKKHLMFRKSFVKLDFIKYEDESDLFFQRGKTLTLLFIGHVVMILLLRLTSY